MVILVQQFHFKTYSMTLHFHFKDYSRGNETLHNDDNVCRAYFCMMPVEGVLVEGEGALVEGEGALEGVEGGKVS